MSGSEPMIGWKEDINSQNIEEERKEGGQDNGLYNRVLVVYAQLRVHLGGLLSILAAFADEACQRRG